MGLMKTKRSQLEATQSANEDIRDNLTKDIGGLQTSIESLEKQAQADEKEKSESSGKLEEHRKQYGNDSELVEKLAINRKTFYNFC